MSNVDHQLLVEAFAETQRRKAIVMRKTTPSAWTWSLRSQRSAPRSTTPRTMAMKWVSGSTLPMRCASGGIPSKET